MDYSVRETVGERLQVLPVPLVLPGKCACCGFVGTNEGDRGDKRVFIDFLLDIDYYGRVYLCSTCLRQAANALSWISLGQAEDLRNKVSQQESELIVLREQNERLRASLVNLLGRSDDPSVPVLLGDSSSERRESEDSEGAVGDSSQGELPLDESPSVEGPDSISADPSGDDDNDTLGEFRL